MKKYEKYILHGVTITASGIIVLLLTAVLSQGAKTHNTLLEIVPKLQRSIKDIAEHDRKIDNLNVAVARQCERIRASLPDSGEC